MGRRLSSCELENRLSVKNTESTGLAVNRSKGDRRERYISLGNARANAVANV